MYTDKTAGQVERILLRPSEVAQSIGCSRSKVYDLIATGRLPAVHLDNENQRLIRVPVSAVRALAEQAPILE